MLALPSNAFYYGFSATGINIMKKYNVTNGVGAGNVVHFNTHSRTSSKAISSKGLESKRSTHRDYESARAKILERAQKIKW